jgi:hypothetical protein
MAFKLSKSELAQYQTLIDSLRIKAEAFEEAKKEPETEGKPSPLMPALANLLVVLDAARDFCESIAERWRDSYEDHSDDWKEGDRGSEIDSMIEEWENVDLSEPDLDGELPDLELEDYAEMLEDLPTEL